MAVDLRELRSRYLDRLGLARLEAIPDPTDYRVAGVRYVYPNGLVQLAGAATNSSIGSLFCPVLRARLG
jgi:hypothetical protein